MPPGIAPAGSANDCSTRPVAWLNAISPDESVESTAVSGPTAMRPTPFPLVVTATTSIPLSVSNVKVSPSTGSASPLLSMRNFTSFSSAV